VSDTLDTIAAMTLDELALAVTTACDLAREPRHQELTSLLWRHAKSLPHLISGYLGAVEKLR